MIKNRGFTLIEMLAVVTVLGIISVLAFPAVDNLLKKTKENEYARFLDDIYLATEAFLIDNQEDYTLTSGMEYVSVKKLVENGYLKSTTINPDTNEKIDLDTSIKVTLADNRYNYEYDDKKSNYDTDGYVSDGLILHYDGYKKPILENSNYVLKDLTGNNNNGVTSGFSQELSTWWDGKCLLFDGISNIVSVRTNQTDDLFDNGNLTLEIVYNYLSTTEGSINFLTNLKFVDGTPGQGGFIGIKNSSGVNNLVVDVRTTGAGLGNYSLTTLETNMKYSFVLTENYNSNETVTYQNTYLNTNLLYSNSRNAVINNSTIPIYIGGAYPSDRLSNVKIYSVRIYNRALTQEEINKNYEIDQERFGL